MKVRIYKPSKTAMQSGCAKTKSWVLEYERTSSRQPEPLMGWTESGDTLNQVKLEFATKEDAISFAESKGWGYVLSLPKERRRACRNYSDNFVYRPTGDNA